MSKRMTVITLALILAVTAPFAVAQETASTEKPAPRLTLVEPLKDFGTVAKGEKITFAFPVKNTGNADLEIIAVKPVCGCTVAEFDKIIKPGQTGRVTAAVDTTAFAGPISKAVTLETNDPNTPTAQLTLSAIVKPYVEAYPAGFVRYNLLQGDSETQTLTLYSEETEPLEIVKIESPQPWIKVTPVKAEGAAALNNIGRPGQVQYKLEIAVGGNDAKIGPIAEKIRIQTNSKHQPEYMISVAGVIRPTFRVEPTTVNFGEVAFSDNAATRTVTLRSNNLKTPENFVVNKVESSVPGVTALVKPTDKKGEYEVTLQVAKTAKPGDLSGEITIHTTDKVKPVVTIPVKAMVKAAS
jgi:hypothetical protein